MNKITEAIWNALVWLVVKCSGFISDIRINIEAILYFTGNMIGNKKWIVGGEHDIYFEYPKKLQVVAVYIVTRHYTDDPRLIQIEQKRLRSSEDEHSSNGYVQLFAGNMELMCVPFESVAFMDEISHQRMLTCKLMNDELADEIAKITIPGRTPIFTDKLTVRVRMEKDMRFRWLHGMTAQVLFRDPEIERQKQ